MTGGNGVDEESFAKVDKRECHNNLITPGNKALKDRVRELTSQIRRIPNKPNHQKCQRDSLGTPSLIIQNKLRYLFQVSPHFHPFRISPLKPLNHLPRDLPAEKIHVAKEILPKTPDKASCVVKSCDKANKPVASTAAMTISL